MGSPGKGLTILYIHSLLLGSRHDFFWDFPKGVWGISARFYRFFLAASFELHSQNIKGSPCPPVEQAREISNLSYAGTEGCKFLLHYVSFMLSCLTVGSVFHCVLDKIFQEGLYPYTAERRDVLKNTPPRTKRFPEGGDFAPRGNFEDVRLIFALGIISRNTVPRAIFPNTLPVDGK